jgi:hypothetical protein
VFEFGQTQQYQSISTGITVVKGKERQVCHYVVNTPTSSCETGLYRVMKILNLCAFSCRAVR